MKTLQIVGRKNSGKTGLLVRLLPLLRERGLRVGSVKHSSHPYSLDRPKSDSARHREAGAEATLVITAAAIALHLPIAVDEAGIEDLVHHFLGSLDLVLIEGWAQRRGPKIEVIPPDKQGAPRPPRHLEGSELLALVLAPNYRPSDDQLVAAGFHPHTGVTEPPAGTAADTAAGTPADIAAGTAAGIPAGIPCFRWEDTGPVADLVMGWYAASEE